jgi:hypothetical protein
MTDPKRVIVAGDWHGNFLWATSQLAAMRHAVPDEVTLYIIHCGDYGFWPGSTFASDTNAIARGLNIRILVTPGNHEDYAKMLPAWEGSIISDANLVALPRGTRWEWHGKKWLSVGGATSPDRNARIAGVNWWPEEELTQWEATAIAEAGPADVLVTHDVGDDVPLPLEPWPRCWPESEYRRARRHRQRVQTMAGSIRPRLWMHGHFHLHNQQVLDMGWGQCQVTSLSNDGKPGNCGILDTRTLEWEGFNP